MLIPTNIRSIDLKYSERLRGPPRDGRTASGILWNQLPSALWWTLFFREKNGKKDFFKMSQTQMKDRFVNIFKPQNEI